MICFSFKSESMAFYCFKSLDIVCILLLKISLTTFCLLIRYIFLLYL